MIYVFDINLNLDILNIYVYVLFIFLIFLNIVYFNVFLVLLSKRYIYVCKRFDCI